MKEALKLFAKLSESYLNEVSSSLNLVKSEPGGAQVIQQLHKSMQLGHDINYVPVDKISWSDLKGSYKGAWVVISGAKGVAAIKASGGNTGDYQALAYNPTTGGVEQISDGRGGNVIDFIKSHVGALKKYYVGKNTGAVRDKQRTRADNKAVAGPQTMNRDTLVKKFKPLWVKAMNSAIADIKGMAQTMIKNDAFEKASKKIERLKNLEQAVDAVDRGDGDIPSTINASVQIAILMAAAHHYPEQTGEITRSRYGGGYDTTNQEGPRQLLADIGNGDTAKLGTILGFFKRSLISG